MRRPTTRVLLTFAAALATLAPRPGGAAIPPGRIAALDSFADPLGRGDFGALFETAPLADPASNSTPLASSAGFYYVLDLQVLPGGALAIVDRDADASGFGPDPNGGNGHGAVFVAAAADQSISLLADGSDYPAGIPPPLRSIFVDPYGISVAPSGVLLVADVDADPSGLGPDAAGFWGHGALFAVDPSTGTVATISDGSSSPDGPPPGGAASWFEDPGSVTIGSDGRTFVLDITADPLATGGRGAVFEVDVATGAVRVVAVSSAFRAPTDLAPISDGRLVVVDQAADPSGDGSTGALFVVDPAAATPDSAVTLLQTDPRFRALGGVDVAPDGSVFVADALADPLGAGTLGAIFRRRPNGQVSVASATPDYRSLVSLQVSPPSAPAPVVLSIDPAALRQGDRATLAMQGTDFADLPEVDLGPDVSSLAVRFLSPTALEVDVEVSASASPGPRDALVTNPDLQLGTLAGGLSVEARPRPRVDSVTPDSARPGESLALTVRGATFADGASVTLGADVTVTGVVVRDATELGVDVTVAGGAALGPRDLVVTNPDLESGTLAGGFRIVPPDPPTLLGIVPATAAPGQRLEVALSGSAFAPGMALDLGPGLLVGSVRVERPSSARADVLIAPAALAGPRDVQVTNPDGQSSVLTGGFVVADLPVLALAAFVVDDSGATGNGSLALDPGETVGLDLTLRNDGSVPATAVGVRLGAPSPGLSIVRSSVSFNDIPPGGTSRRAAPPFPEVALSDAAACAGTAEVDVEILADGAVLRVVRLAVPVGRVSTWRRKPVVEGVQAGGARGAAVALADVDGDGVADLVVGAPSEDVGGLLAAGTLVAISGRTDDPIWSLPGDEAGASLGAAVAGVGDLTGDGVEDLVVGAPGASANAGRVLLVSGSDRAVLQSLTGPPGSRLGSAVAPAGDRDLDGRQEVVAGGPSFASDGGIVLVLTPDLVEIDRLVGAPSARRGAAVALLGDVDGDGLDDVAVGEPGAQGSGAVLVWGGDGTLRSVAGTAPGEEFGASLGSGGDATSDGVFDLVVGAPSSSPGGLALAGRALVLDGRDLSAVREIRGGSAGDALGASVGLQPDVDGDGSAEVLTGAPGALGEDGVVEMRSGRSGALLWSLAGAASSRGRLGTSLAAGRDASGDAFPDLLAGAPRAASPSVPLAGHAVAGKSEGGCDAYVPCSPDAFEPNDTNAIASPIGYGTFEGLAICRGDVDVFELAPPAGRRMVARVLFAHAAGDLDASLHDSFDALLDASLSVDDDEEVGPFGPGGGPFRLKVFGFDGAANDYALVVLDPDACPPVAEVEDLRVAKAAAGSECLLTWQPSADPCHAQDAGEVAYRVFASPTPAPAPGPGGAFPLGTSFVDVNADDGDLDAADPSYLDLAGPGSRYYLVADVGRAGETGPAGWSAAP